MDPWITLNNPEQLHKISNDNSGAYFIIFKHSTRCSLSSMIYDRLKARLKVNAPVYYLDLLQFRTLSQLVSEIFQVAHESPQILIIQNGKCIYHESHSGIVPSDIEKELSN
jgi:bacillithiol system protein YtxJ